MADEPSWDEIFSSQPAPTGAQGRAAQPAPPLTRRELRERDQAAPGGARPPRRTDDNGLPPRRPKRRRLTWLWVLLAVLVLVVGGGTVTWFSFQPQIRHVLGWENADDYTGTGTTKVVVTIQNGQIGSDVAQTLHKAGVTKTADAFYRLLLTKPGVSFQPGSYALKKEMSAKSALAALQDPKNKVVTRIVVPEGFTVKQIIARLAALSEATGISQAQLESASADYKSYGLPPEAPSLEGYLFPATYDLNPGIDAHGIFQMMVTKMFSVLDAEGVAPADRHKVLTLAGLTQKEGGNTADFYKVARVWDNRLAQGMNLQSDATVAYGAGSSSIETTPAQRADKSNPYNTYANPGLPIGPISNPGQAAIDATLHPADGSWLFFVVVNCSTGETAFSDTQAQQNAASQQLIQWLKSHPGGCD